MMYEREHPFDGSDVVYGTLVNLAVEASKRLNGLGIYNIGGLMTGQEHKLIGSTAHNDGSLTSHAS